MLLVYFMGFAAFVSFPVNGAEKFSVTSDLDLGFQGLPKTFRNSADERVRAVGAVGRAPGHIQLLLWRGIETGNINLVKNAISRGADVNAPNVHNMDAYPIHKAASSCKVEILEGIIAGGAFPQVTDPDGWTALHYAASKGCKDVLKLLITLLNVNVLTKSNSSALHIAASQGHISTVKMLLDSGADVNARNKGGYTPLHLAVFNGIQSAVAMLINHGGIVNAVSNYGETPLHDAAKTGYRTTTLYLLNNGANVNAKADDGKTPLTYAKLYGHLNIVELLKSKGANDEDETNLTPHRSSIPII